MFIPCIKYQHQLRRVISAAVMLFVFFLPFHLHFSTTVTLGKECSCFQGTRTQLAPAAGTATFTPIFQIALLTVRTVSPMTDDWTTLQNVRAPPATLSA